MKETIRRMAEQAYEKNDFRLAQYVSDLTHRLAETDGCPEEWRQIGKELAEEYSGNIWITNFCFLDDFLG